MADRRTLYRTLDSNDPASFRASLFWVVPADHDPPTTLRIARLENAISRALMYGRLAPATDRLLAAALREGHGQVQDASPRTQLSEEENS